MSAMDAALAIPSTGYVGNLKLGALKAIGRHNYNNAVVATFSVLGLEVGIDIGAISITVEVFSTLSHRMQVVCNDSGGVTWVDDSKATNVESTYTGLMGPKDHKLVILLGGLAKAMENQESNGFEQLIEPLKYYKGIITVIQFSQARLVLAFDEFRNFEHRGKVFQEISPSSQESNLT